jgi:hypothetical protein
MFAVHPPELRTQALALLAEGINDCEVARRLGVPRTTVRDWRRPRYAPVSPVAARERCWRCWRPTRRVSLTAADYAELLGLYLGDGHISPTPRTERLRIFLDAKYTRIVDETEALLRRIFPQSRVGRGSRHHGSMTVLSVYYGHLCCLFPQHGPGKKHERPIVLEPWQSELVAAAPWALLRGCIRSDGCVFVNRTGLYSYLSYDFSNRSADIREIFASVCETAGLRPRRNATHVRLNRRADVALLREHVGVKP